MEIGKWLKKKTRAWIYPHSCISSDKSIHAKYLEIVSHMTYLGKAWGRDTGLHRALCGTFSGLHGAFIAPLRRCGLLLFYSPHQLFLESYDG